MKTLAAAPLALVAGSLVLPLAALAQVPKPAPIRPYEVNADHTVTFHYRAPGAAKVQVGVDVIGKPIEMTKDDAGVWSATTPALPPEIYSYHYEVDGNTSVDAGNPWVTRSLVGVSNMLEVPGDTPQLWDARNVPHGVVHHHTYNTGVVLGLENNQSSYYVYTPPSYDPKAKKDYPVLFLLHGWSDDASGWTAVGQANNILDNLLAQGKIKPMVVVMPLGYGDMSFVRDYGVWSNSAAIDHNVDLYQKALLTEVLPQVESEYRISKKREERAIAGLSMGGLESLTIGLTHTDMFAYVGGFSSAVHRLDADKVFAGLTPKGANLKLLWIACGVDDQLIEPNRRLVGWLKTRQMPVTAIETPGRHTWPVWRDNLIHLTPLLFQ